MYWEDCYDCGCQDYERSEVILEKYRNNSLVLLLYNVKQLMGSMVWPNIVLARGKRFFVTDLSFLMRGLLSIMQFGISLNE